MKVYVICDPDNDLFVQGVLIQQNTIKSEWHQAAGVAKKFLTKAKSQQFIDWLEMSRTFGLYKGNVSLSIQKLEYYYEV